MLFILEQHLKILNNYLNLKNLKGCCGIKLFAGSSTGNLLVDKEADIEKVISNADRIVSIHSEDEEILNLRKNLSKRRCSFTSRMEK